jgi:hypothetical protein
MHNRHEKYDKMKKEGSKLFHKTCTTWCEKYCVKQNHRNMPNTQPEYLIALQRYSSPKHFQKCFSREEFSDAGY